MTESKNISFRRKIVLGLSVTACACVVMLLFGELLLRLIVPSSTVPDWFVIDDHYGYVHKKNFSQTFHYAYTNVVWTATLNSLGLRDDDVDLTRSDQKRVLLLGDSFTFGYGLELGQIFASKLEKMLNSDTDSYVVINTGHGGWGTIQQVKYAMDHMALFDPDYIVLTYCENDQSDDMVFLQGASSGFLPSFPGKRFLRIHSYLYRVIYHAVHKTLYLRAIEAQVEAQTSHDEPLPTEKASSGGASTPVEVDSAWKQTLKSINELRDGFLNHNPNGVMLIQATDPMRSDVRKYFSALDDGETIVFVNLVLDADALGREGMMLAYERHWTEAMHERSAKRLYEQIMKIESERQEEK